MDASLDLLDEAMDFANNFVIDTSVKKEQIDKSDGSPLPEQTACKVCGDSATGMYFGAQVCVPCKVEKFNNICVFVFSSVSVSSISYRRQ